MLSWMFPSFHEGRELLLAVAVEYQNDVLADYLARSSPPEQNLQGALTR